MKEEEVADAVAEIEALRALVADHDDVQALVVQLHQAHPSTLSPSNRRTCKW